MHMQSALKSVQLRLFRANCRSDRQFDAKPAPSPQTGGRPPLSVLVAEGGAFDDLDLPVANSLVLGRAPAPQVEAIVAAARGLTRERARCR
jgi:hypothetical protein